MLFCWKTDNLVAGELELARHRQLFKNLFSADIYSSLVKTHRSISGLCDLIGYQQEAILESSGAATGVNSVKNSLENIWKNRDANASKESVPIMTTVATMGQGKTELCRQLVLADDLHVNLEDVDLLRSFSVSFNQGTSYSVTEESSMSIEQSLCWRLACAVLGSCDHKLAFTNYSLADLIDDIRDCISDIKGCQKLGLLINIDEFLKIRSPENQKILLELIAGLQQALLERSEPLFFLVTSLSFSTSMYKFRTESGRPISLILLPMISDSSLRTVCQTVYEDILEAATASSSIDFRKEVEHRGDLQRLVVSAVWFSGRHFRSLETMLRSIFEMTVSPASKVRSSELKTSKLARSPYFNASTEATLILDTREVKDRWAILVCGCVSHALRMPNLHELFPVLLQLFLSLVVNDNRIVIENDHIYELENAGVLFVRSRTPNAITSINPRVSLPFLYLYGQQLTRNALWIPGPLSTHIPWLLVDIFSGVNGLDEELSHAFEKVMPAVELVRIQALFSFERRTDISLFDILPECIFKPWTAESLSLSSWVCDSAKKMVPSTPLETNALDRKKGSDHLFRMACSMALNDKSSSVVITQDRRAVLPMVEHIGRSFTALNPDDIVDKKEVLTLNSMKLRRASSHDSPEKLANEMHRYVKENTDLLDSDYYAVIYCCVPRGNIDYDSVHPGTIIVPLESLRILLGPFGATSLLYLAEMKGIE